MKKYLFLIAALIGLSNLTAQPAEVPQPSYYSAYLVNDLPALKAAIREMEKAYEKAPSPQQLLAIAKAEYGAVGACFARNDEKTAKHLLDKAAKRTKTLLEQQPSGEAHALYAGILGMKIAISPIKAPFLGGQSVKHAQEGVSLAPENAFVRLQHGNNLYYTPPAFGGDLSAAIADLQYARRAYEAKAVETSWEYLLCLANLGQAQQAADDHKAALEAYEKALAIAPEFAWVKYELLPKLKERL